MSPYQDRLDFALNMASAASEIILKYYQTGNLNVQAKADDSPVTVADKGAEQCMREMLLSQFPDDGVLGEEFDDKPSNNGFRWILDPIDGTKPFIHGVPLFGTLIGVELNGRMVAGVCAFPALDEVVYAAEGSGTWWRIGSNPPVRTRVTTEDRLDQSRVMFTEPSSWDPVGRFDILSKIIRGVRVARGWGDCYGHAMVATGRAEMAIDPIMSAWDIAALIPILREAGGACVDWRGNEDIFGGDGVSVNAALKDDIIPLLREVPRL
ncbi:MAG: histidinol-phosphatase [Planctomycetaceae bacterium]|nr:histidinol-phosphatase [Planctomycetaceae bacterium]